MGNSGVGVAGVVTIVFIVLKVIGTITWSWWWVFSPIFISWGIIAFMFLLLLVFSVLD